MNRKIIKAQSGVLPIGIFEKARNKIATTPVRKERVLYKPNTTFKLSSVLPEDLEKSIPIISTWSSVKKAMNTGNSSDWGNAAMNAFLDLGVIVPAARWLGNVGKAGRTMLGFGKEARRLREARELTRSVNERMRGVINPATKKPLLLNGPIEPTIPAPDLLAPASIGFVEAPFRYIVNDNDSSITYYKNGGYVQKYQDPAGTISRRTPLTTSLAQKRHAEISRQYFDLAPTIGNLFKGTVHWLKSHSILTPDETGLITGVAPAVQTPSWLKPIIVPNKRPRFYHPKTLGIDLRKLLGKRFKKIPKNITQDATSVSANPYGDVNVRIEAPSYLESYTPLGDEYLGMRIDLTPD